MGEAKPILDGMKHVGFLFVSLLQFGLTFRILKPFLPKSHLARILRLAIFPWKKLPKHAKIMHLLTVFQFSTLQIPRTMTTSGRSEHSGSRRWEMLQTPCLELWKISRYRDTLGCQSPGSQGVKILCIHFVWKAPYYITCTIEVTVEWYSIITISTVLQYWGRTQEIPIFECYL